MIKIIIADDHPIIIDGLISILNDVEDIKVVDTAYDGVELIDKIKKHPPHIVLLDINMPLRSGIEVSQEIFSLNKNIKVIFLTQYDDKWLVKKCIDVGAQGYLLKNISRKDLIYAIHKVYDESFDFVLLQNRQLTQ